MDKSGRILVTGGTGFIGSYILRLLVDQGYEHIIATRRKQSKMDLVEPVIEKVGWYEVDLLDSPGVYEVVEQVDFVIHAAAIVSFDHNDTSRLLKVNVEGTSNLVNACLEYGVKKFIHVSSIAVFSRKPGAQTITEETTWDYQYPNTNYAISKYKSEMEVWRAGSEGLPIAIINPSLVLGSGFWEMGSASLFKKIYQNLKFYPTGINGFVDVRDVAKAVLILLENPIEYQRFIISGENRSYKEIIGLIAKALDKKAPNIAMNVVLRELALLRAWILRRIFGKPEVITRGTLRNAQGTFHFDNSKSKEILGLQYRPIEQTIEESCAQLKVAATNDFSPKYLPLW
jgi:nucleoside-diphosphate-sugar epimerase